MSFSAIDPIEKIEIRAATPQESAQQRGGFIWSVVRLPWDITRKVMGTAKLIFVGANGMLWGRPAVQTWVDKACFRLGYRPEETFMDTFHTYPIGNLHMVSGSTKAMKAIFSHHRNRDLLANNLSMNKLYEFCTKVFPDDQITKDDFMLTCSPEKTKEYRSLLHTLLKGAKIKDFAPEIREITESTLNAWSAESEAINATIETRIHTTQIITRLMFETDASGVEIAQAIDFMNAFITKTILRQVTAEDEAKFQNSLSVFRSKVDEVLNNESTPILAQENTLTLAQKKVLIFTIFFAGQETTASLLAWILYRLASDSKLQEDLKDPMLAEHVDPADSLFNQEIAHFTPAFAVGRKLAQDACIEYQLKGETATRKLVLFKDEIISASIWREAQNKLASYNTSNCNEWLPFGYGPHSCPGEALAKTIVTCFVRELLSNYTVTLASPMDPQKVGLFTLKLSEDVKINVTRSI